MEEARPRIAIRPYQSTYAWMSLTLSSIESDSGGGSRISAWLANAWLMALTSAVKGSKAATWAEGWGKQEITSPSNANIDSQYQAWKRSIYRRMKRFLLLFLFIPMTFACNRLRVAVIKGLKGKQWRNIGRVLNRQIYRYRKSKTRYVTTNAIGEMLTIKGI